MLSLLRLLTSLSCKERGQTQGNREVMVGRLSGRPAIPVQCVETGVIYASLGEACRAVNRTRKAVLQSVKRGNKCAGYTWKLITPEEYAASLTEDDVV
eukprot:g34283.t1